MVDDSRVGPADLEKEEFARLLKRAKVLVEMLEGEVETPRPTIARQVQMIEEACIGYCGDKYYKVLWEQKRLELRAEHGCCHNCGARISKNPVPIYAECQMCEAEARSGIFPEDSKPS